MILSLLIKFLRIGIIGTTIFAIGHIIYTIINYNNMLTALPFGTIIALEIAFWIVIVLIITAVYFSLIEIQKRIKANH
jgi:hypothetical protein